MDFKLKIIIALLAVFPILNFGQNLRSQIEALSEELQTVQASKAEYAQSLKLNTTNYIDYTLTEVDSKGNAKETTYNFSFSDIDINTVRTVTKKDIIITQLLVSGKQKLIKKISNNGDKVSYVDNVFFFAKNIDNGRDLVEAIKKVIPVNQTLEENKLVLSGYKDHEAWLINHIQDVDFIKTQIIQKIEDATQNNGHIKT